MTIADHAPAATATIHAPWDGAEVGFAIDEMTELRLLTLSIE